MSLRCNSVVRSNPLGGWLILQRMLEKCIVKLWNGSYWPMTNFLNISDDPTTALSDAKFSFTGRSFTFTFLRICNQSRHTHTHTVLLYKRSCRAVGWTALEVQWWARCEVELLIFQQLTWSQSSAGQMLQRGGTPRWPSRARLALTVRSSLNFTTYRDCLVWQLVAARLCGQWTANTVLA